MITEIMTVSILQARYFPKPHHIGTIVMGDDLSERPAPTTARPQRKRRREEINDVPPCSDSKSPVRIAIVDKTTSFSVVQNYKRFFFSGSIYLSSTSAAGMTVAVLLRLSIRRRPVPIHPFSSEFRLHVPPLVIHLIKSN